MEECRYFATCKDLSEAMSRLRESDMTQNFSLQAMNEALNGLHKDLLVMTESLKELAFESKDNNKNLKSHLEIEEEREKVRTMFEEQARKDKVEADVKFQKSRDMRFKVYAGVATVGTAIFSYAFTQFVHSTELRDESIAANSKALVELNIHHAHTDRYIIEVSETLKELRVYMREKK